MRRGRMLYPFIQPILLTSTTLLVPVNRRTMRVRQEGVHGVADGVEPDRVRTAFRRDALKTAHRPGVEDVDDARIANRDIEMPKSGVEEDDVRRAADRMLTLNGSR